MDVTCPRCQTDYEFDDALVSERGTTVKCTNCGHQFRVFRPQAASGPELWKIERKSGEPLELRSLVELQRAIRAGRISRNDLLRRGDGAPRRIGDIPELEPFFPTTQQGVAQHTLPLPSVGEGSAVAMPPRAASHTPAYGRRAPSVPPPAPNQRTGGTLRPPVGPLPPPRTPTPPRPDRLLTPLGLSPLESDPATQRNVPAVASSPPVEIPKPPPLGVASPVGSPVGTLAPLGSSKPPAADDDAEPSTHRREQQLRPPPSSTNPTPSREELYDSLFPSTERRKKRSYGWLYALLIVGGCVAIGATVGRPYIAKALSLTGLGTATSSSANPSRLQEALATGDKARDEGDFATARDMYIRATELDEKSIAAWDGECTAESELAMVQWIGSLATPSSLQRGEAKKTGEAAGKSCARWAELARGAGDSAKADADLRPARALAAQGNGARLRLFLAQHSEPILDALVMLADATGKDATAVTAAATSAAGSLAKIPFSTFATPGDVAVATFCAGTAGDATRLADGVRELEKRAPKHMLLDTLRKLGEASADAGVGGATDAGAADAGAAKDAGSKDDAKVATATTDTNTAGTSTGTTPPAGDYRELDKKGHDALLAGNVASAETFFRGAIAQNPGDLDALYGLAQIESSRGNSSGAASYYQQILDRSPGYAPARLGLADAQWAQGNQGAAVSNYKMYLESTSSGSGADRARQRIQQVEGGATTPAPTTSDTPAPTPVPSTTTTDGF